MTEITTYRLSKVAKDLNIGLDHIVESLNANGIAVEKNPNAKINQDAFNVLLKEFSQDKAIKEESDILASQKVRHDVHIEMPKEPETKKRTNDEDDNVSLRDSLDKIKKDSVEKAIKTKKEEAHKVEVPKVEAIVETPKQETAPVIVEQPPVVEPEVAKPAAKKETKKATPKEEVVEVPAEKEIEAKTDDDVIRAKPGKIDGPTVLGNIVLPDEKSGKGKKKKGDIVAAVPEPVAEEKKSKTGKKKKEDEVVAETPQIAEPVKEATPVENTEKPITAPEPEKPAGIETLRMETKKLVGPNVIGKIVLPTEESKRKPAGSSSQNAEDRKKKRKRTDKRLTSSSGTHTPGAPGTGQRGPNPNPNQPHNRPPHKSDPRKPFVPHQKVEPTDKEIQDQIKATLQKLSGSGKSRGSKMRREKRSSNTQRLENAEMEEMANKKIQVTEFVTANELAKLLGVNVTQIISTCMSLGMFVSINQRLDAETLTLVAEEFNHEVEFVSAEVQEAINDTPDAEEDLIPRAPIVTVMGHVDHGKTSLLDYVRSANVIAGEAGGITQHIGAYEVTLEDGRAITFLDTPGHEAFTAMRARGAKITDVAIIVIAADDSVMPQTIEAINHAQAAGVPIVFAFNKMDKPDAAPDRIREQLSKMNIMVEEWGGKFQTQEISAKKGLNIDKLLDKVLLEAEILDLKANPSRNAKGTVIEATLDKGRGYVTTMLVQNGTIKTGDILLAGCHSGRVKAMFNERGQKLEVAGPSAPVMLLGLSGAPQAGDQFNVMDDEREARDIANKRLQLQREQGLRTHKHITLDEIGRRLAIGNFKELNVIVKGDVDGSVEALADSLLKLSNEEIQVNVIHKSVGQISESDVLLASASNAIVIGFQVRPSVNARKLAEAEQIDIRLYSIIYNAINEIKSAMEGMLAPEFEEKIVCNIEIRETFKIPKVGTIAGCMVLEGKVTRNTKVRVVRDGIVLHSGELASLKRFKDDVKEVLTGYECGLNLASFNDIQIGDIIEGYEQVAVKRTLA